MVAIFEGLDLVRFN